MGDEQEVLESPRQYTPVKIETTTEEVYDLEAEVERAKYFDPGEDRCVVLADPRIDKQNGIELPEQAREKRLMGTVVAAGPGAHDFQGVLQPNTYGPGDRVHYNGYAGSEWEFEFDDGTKRNYLVMRAGEVLVRVRAAPPMEEPRMCRGINYDEPEG